MIKHFEIRDRATFIPCFAFDVVGDSYLTRMAGYGDRCIMFGNLSGGVASYDSNHWKDRTYYIAHKYIEDHWDSLNDGDVIDVEYILGESKTPKISQRLE